jgi:hypothetical protein
MANVLVGQPLDTIKVRLQLDQGKFKGAWDCTIQTIQKEGFFALYKGTYQKKSILTCMLTYAKVWQAL